MLKNKESNFKLRVIGMQKLELFVKINFSSKIVKKLPFLDLIKFPNQKHHAFLTRTGVNPSQLFTT